MAQEMTVLTRFAPAPTGYLHLGHVVNAIYVWGWGRVRGADVLLRIEDHDRQRARPEYESALLDDLDWLGFVPDRFPTQEFRRGVCASRQRDRHHIYGASAQALMARGLVYGCSCSRQDIARERARLGLAGAGYPGTCRNRRIAPAIGVAWRVRLESSVERFEDAWCGPCEQHPSQDGGDPLIRDREGHWTYQFAVTVDDDEQEIEWIIRGRDLLTSTGTQIALGRLIGRASPAQFAHHALVMKSPTQKLSKSDGDSGVRDLRAAGWSPEQVIGAAAAAVGLAPAGTLIAASDVSALFA